MFAQFSGTYTHYKTFFQSSMTNQRDKTGLQLLIDKATISLALNPKLKTFSMKNIAKLNFLIIARASIKFLSNFSLIPFFWEGQLGQYGKMQPKPPGKQYLWYAWCTILWLRTIALGFKLMYQVQTNQINLGIGIIFLLWLSVFIAGSLLTVHPIVKLKEFCLTFNAFAEFELKQGVAPLTGGTNILSTLLFVQTSCIPFVLPMFCWVAPCAPQFIGSSFLINEFGKCSASWMHKLLMYNVEVVCSLPIGGICSFFSVYAIYLTKSLNRILVFVRNKSVKRTKKIQHVSSMIYCSTMYRQTQILLHLYHDCFQMQLLPNMLFSSSVIIICCLFSTVELKNELPFVVYMGFPFILTLTSGFLLITLEMASRVGTLSKSIKIEWKSRYTGRSSWFKRFSRSCPPLKIVAGPFSKIGRDRIAIVIRFCLQRTIFFIVWSRRSRDLQLH